MREYDQPVTRRRPPQRRTHKQDTGMRPIFALLVVIVILSGGVFFLWQHLHSNTGYIPVVLPEEDSGNLPSVSRPDNTTEPYPTEEEYEIVLIPTPLDQLMDTWYLKLVNRDLAMSRPIDYAYIVYAWPTVPVRATEITVHYTLLNAISGLFEDGRDVAEFFVTSGYRNVARQAQIYENAVDRMYVMPPGHSEHNLGLAADILAPGLTLSSAEMSGTPEAVWLAENAWRHGMVLRYPYGTTHITGVAYEPWHFRYVGRVHAWYMTMYGMVLEEYLEYLAGREELTVQLDGVTYHIWYQYPVNGQLYVPQDLPFNVSSSNRGGYVITAWE
ncbi:MAG: M15 family metallopeptidase [Firmicutes bacterium]|nr:M15 family metallopeptidase [Bacillota bacterium]